MASITWSRMYNGRYLKEARSARYFGVARKSAFPVSSQQPTASMPKENEFLQQPTRPRNRSGSWHRTRSRSRHRREALSTQPAGIEHLVHAFLEYAMHLFRNGMSRAQDSPDSSQTQDSSRMNEFTHVLLTQIMKYAIRRYLKSRKSQASKKRVQRKATNSAEKRGRSKHRDEVGFSPRTASHLYREAMPTSSQRKYSHGPHQSPPPRVYHYAAQLHRPRPVPESHLSPLHGVTEAQYISILLAALDDLQWLLERSTAEVRQVRELVQKPTTGKQFNRA